MRDLTMSEINTDLHVKSDLGMYYCGKRINSTNHTYGPEIRKHYLFVFVNSGKALLHTKDGDVAFGTGDLLVMLPDNKVHYTTLTSWNIQWVGLYGDEVDRLTKQLNIDKNRPLISITMCHQLKEIFEEIYSYQNERTPFSDMMQISLIYRFFAILLNRTDTEKEKNYVVEAKKIIDYNFNCINVEKLSERLHLNPSYLSRIFKKELQISPKHYILKKKTERAKELLGTDASISEIAYSIGFTDSLYFSRIFKKYEGISPSDYRKQL